MLPQPLTCRRAHFPACDRQWPPSLHDCHGTPTSPNHQTLLCRFASSSAPDFTHVGHTNESMHGAARTAQHHSQQQQQADRLRQHQQARGRSCIMTPAGALQNPKSTTMLCTAMPSLAERWFRPLYCSAAAQLKLAMSNAVTKYLRCTADIFTSNSVGCAAGGHGGSAGGGAGCAAGAACGVQGGCTGGKIPSCTADSACTCK